MKPNWLIVISILMVYCLAYLAARQSHWLIHRVGYATKTDGSRLYVHYVDRGELGHGMMFLVLPAWKIRVIGRAQDGIYWIFTPLRWGEIGVWHVAPREYNFRH